LVFNYLTKENMWLFQSTNAHSPLGQGDLPEASASTPILNADYREEDDDDIDAYIAGSEAGGNVVEDESADDRIYGVNPQRRSASRSGNGGSGGKIEHISVGSVDRAVSSGNRKWKREYVLPFIAAIVAVFIFVACFIWIPRSPSISVKKTVVDITEQKFSVQQTYSLANRNVYEQRIKDFAPQLKFITSSKRMVQAYGVVNTNYTSFDVTNFVIDATASRTIVMDFEFLLATSEADDASARCNNQHEGIYLTTTGTLDMQTFGKSFDEINIGVIASLVHCNSE
jgi:hypothetical protein